MWPAMIFVLQTTTMLPPHLITSLLVILFSLCRSARSTALTTAITANERLCFYADVDKAGEKIGVSFSTANSDVLY